METALGTILLVDDDDSDIELALHTIKHKAPSMTIDIVRNGADALEYFFPNNTDNGSATLNNLRIVLLDLHMPGIDGLEVLKRLKANDATKEIPIVIFSSSREIKDIESCYRCGANSYIVKPISMELYEDVIEKIIYYWSYFNETKTHHISFPLAHT